MGQSLSSPSSRQRDRVVLERTFCFKSTVSDLPWNSHAFLNPFLCSYSESKLDKYKELIP